ncbi:MAG: hypothetical protein Q9228_002647 [Teloschistes exilis]
MSEFSAASDANVRFATEADVPTILALVHELAAYEKASSSVLATEESLLKTLSFAGSSSTGYARTLLVFPPNSEECAGLALFFHNYSTWRAAPGIYLEDLFVRPAYRGRGYGKRLLGELARETKRVGGGRLEWSVLKWNEPSLKFYEGLGAQRMDEWVGMRIDDLGKEGVKNVGDGSEGEGALAGLGRWGKGVEWR